MRKKNGWISIGLVCALLLSGCGALKQENIESEELSAGQEQQNAEETAEDALDESLDEAKGSAKKKAAYGDVISVEDIKKAYDYDDSDAIMPLYNVAEDEHFTFDFAFSAYDEDISLYDFVSIHTDAACEEESAVYYTAALTVEENVTHLTVSPMTPVLATETQQKEYVYEDVESWGNAPIYYIAIHYDREADKPVKLEQPVIIPFTVNHEVTAPTVQGVVSEDGRFSLQWEPVEGAEKYVIYHLTDNALYTGTDNHALDGAKMGYDCGIKSDSTTQLYLLWEDETTECTFDGFAGKEGHSTAEIYDDITGKYSNSGQNYCVCGEYFVTAVVNGRESGLSNVVTTAELAIPYRVKEESEIQGRYPTPADFPLEVEVQNIDGSSTMRKVTYERSHVVWFEFEWDEYDYKIEGTYLYGAVKFDEDVGDPMLMMGLFPRGSGNTAPKDGVKRIPKADVKTIIPSGGEAEGAEDSLIGKQAKNTREHIKKGNQATVNGLPEGVYFNADTAEEEWMARNLLQANTEISMEGFTSLQNPYTLVDVFHKVYYQNPYVMGILSFEYDYNTMVFRVNYAYDRETVREKQTEAAKKADQIISANISKRMDEQEKIHVLYDYLNDHAAYDQAALEEVEAKHFSKQGGLEHEDAFNVYGVLVEESGVCMSYAYAFKLLCDLCDVECIVATGELNGTVPHAWNMVRLDGKWYEIDCTNNAVNTGIPYYLYQVDSRLARNSGYIKNNKFAMDDDIKTFKGKDGSMEYYYQNGLCPQNMKEYEKILLDRFDADDGILIVRWDGELDKESFEKSVVRAMNRLGLEDRLEGLRYTLIGGFLIVESE